MSDEKPPDPSAMSPEELMEIREQLGMRQRMLADELDVHPSTVSRYESGAMAIPGDVAQRVRALLAAMRHGQAHPGTTPGAPAPPPPPAPTRMQAVPRSPPPGSRPSPDGGVTLSRSMLWFLGGTLFAGELLLGLLVIFHPWMELKQGQSSPVVELPQLPSREPLPLLEPVPIGVMDGGQPTRLGQLLPGPMKGQKPPPCRPGETEKSGNCWLGTDWTTPCPSYAVELEGRCFMRSPDEPPRKSITGDR